MTLIEIFSVKRREGCPSPFLLRRLFVGDLGEEEEGVRKHVAGCESCQRELDALTEEERSFLSETDPSRFAEQILARARTIPKETSILHRFRMAFPLFPRITMRVLIPALATVSVLVLAAPLLREKVEAPSTRTKGMPALGFFIEREGKSVEGRPGEILAPGDLIQFVYSTGGLPYVMIVGIEETGRVWPVFVSEEGKSVRSEEGKAPVPSATRLDDYAGKEVFLALFSEKPLHLEAVEETLLASLHDFRSKNLGLGSLADLPLPALQVRLPIEKKR